MLPIRDKQNITEADFIASMQSEKDILEMMTKTIYHYTTLLNESIAVGYRILPTDGYKESLEGLIRYL